MRSRWSRGGTSPASASNGSSVARSLVVGRSPPWSARRREGTAKRRGGGLIRRRAALGRIDRSGAGIGGGGLGAEIGPGLQIVERVDDAPADLAVLRPGAVGAVLLKRAAGEAEETRGFGRAQKARRQAGERVGHDRASVIFASAAAFGGALRITMAECDRKGGWRRSRR